MNNPTWRIWLDKRKKGEKRVFGGIWKQYIIASAHIKDKILINQE